PSPRSASSARASSPLHASTTRWRKTAPSSGASPGCTRVPARRSPRSSCKAPSPSGWPWREPTRCCSATWCRSTSSSSPSPQPAGRGIVPAREWLAAEFSAIAKGSRLKPFEDRFTAQPDGKRIPSAVEIVNVGVILPGSDSARSKQAIVMTAHYDSMPSDVMDPKADAPGAIDDASGTAMALELANALKDESPALTVYLVAVAGEEQGLIGSQHLARR